MKKIIFTFLTAIIIILLLLVIGGDLKSPNHQTSVHIKAFLKTSIQDETSDQAKPIKIEFFNMKKEVSEIMDELIKNFQKENPNITIEQTIVPDSPLVLQTRMASGDTPELFTQWPNATWRNQVKQGFILNLTGEKCISNIEDGVLEQYKIDGKDYIAPISYNTVGVYYNKRIFSNYGLSVPKTYDELMLVCKKLKSAGEIPFLISRTALLTEWYTLLPSMPGYDQFIKDTVAGDLKLESKDYDIKKITEKFLEIVSFSQLDVINSDVNQSIIDFTEEKGAMLIMGSWKVRLIKKANPNLDFEMFPMPADNAEDVIALAFPGDMALCISSKAVYPEESKKFIEYVTKYENANIYSDKDGSPSCIKGVNAIVPQLANQYNVIKAGKFKVNPDANWMSDTNYDIGIALNKLIIDKNINNFLSALDSAYKKEVSN